MDNPSPGDSVLICFAAHPDGVFVEEVENVF